jgi:hypothetical protein
VRDAIKREPDPSRVAVHYRFDAVPGALRIAIPNEYDGPLFTTSQQVARKSV